MSDAIPNIDHIANDILNMSISPNATLQEQKTTLLTQRRELLKARLSNGDKTIVALAPKRNPDLDISPKSQIRLLTINNNNNNNNDRQHQNKLQNIISTVNVEVTGGEDRRSLLSSIENKLNAWSPHNTADGYKFMGEMKKALQGAKISVTSATTIINLLLVIEQEYHFISQHLADIVGETLAVKNDKTPLPSFSKKKMVQAFVVNNYNSKLERLEKSRTLQFEDPSNTVASLSRNLVTLYSIIIHELILQMRMDLATCQNLLHYSLRYFNHLKFSLHQLCARNEDYQTEFNDIFD